MSLQIKYKKSFVAYLDVLGFKNLVNQNKIDNIELYFTVINEEIEKLRKIQAKEDIGSIIISDSVILTMPQDTRDKSGNLQRLRQLCIAIGKIQQRLALDNIWFRGAIAGGDTYFDSKNNQIVGPAYINAFLLEEEFAIYPRVILDSKIIGQLGFTTANQLIISINKSYDSARVSDWGERIFFNWYEGNVSGKTSIHQDVPFFIDYIYPLVEKRDKVKLQKIIDNIKINIYEDIKIYPKHRWLTNYIKEITSKYSEGSEINQDMYFDLFGI